MALALPGSALALTLTAGPVVRGQQVELIVSGGVPGRSVYFVYGNAAGAGPCPVALGGVCLDVVAPMLIGQRAANASGVATLNLTVPANTALVDLVLQAVQGGPTPGESPVVPAPVLQIRSGTLNVVDAATLEEARHTLALEPSGALWLQAGYGTDLTLPSLQRIRGDLVFDGQTPLSLTAPALVSADAIRIETQPGGTVDATFGALTTLGVLASTTQYTHPGQPLSDTLTIHLPVLVRQTGELSLQVSGDLTLDAPQLDRISALAIYGVAGDLTLNLPNLRTVDSWLSLSQLGTATVMEGWFPSLESAWDLSIGRNPRLTRIGALGTGSVELVNLLSIRDNPVLVEVSGFGVLGVNAEVANNPMLPSCQAWDVVLDGSSLGYGGGYPELQICQGNALDTCSDEPTDDCD